MKRVVVKINRIIHITASWYNNTRTTKALHHISALWHHNGPKRNANQEKYNKTIVGQKKKIITNSETPTLIMDTTKEGSDFTTNFIPGNFNPLSKDITQYIRQSFSRPAYQHPQHIEISRCSSEKKFVSDNVKIGKEKVSVETENDDEVWDSKFDLCFRMLSLPPRYSTLRVNLLAITKEKAQDVVRSYLKDQYRDKHSPLPLVYPHHSLPDLLVVESSGMINLKPADKEVVVGKLCGCAVLRGAEVFAPGVMALSSEVRTGDKVAVYADLEEKCLKGSKIFTGKKMFVGNGIALMSRRELFVDKINSGVAISMKEQLFHSPSLGDCFQDMIFLQNLPSIICSHILKPEKNSVVLDMCAAPGGKTTHIASLMCNTGQVIALDRSKTKIGQIMANSERLGLTNIKAYQYDSTKLVIDETYSSTKSPESTNTNSSITEVLTSGKGNNNNFVPPFHGSSFRYILLDAPCSALGQRPQLHTKTRLKELQSFPGIQRRLLENAVELLQPGGRLVYSTCTIMPQENERMVRWVLDNFSDVVLVDCEVKYGIPGLPGCGLDHEECCKVRRFGPAFVHNNGTDLHNSKSSLHSIEAPVIICDSDVHSIMTSFASVDTDTIGFFIAVFTKDSTHSLSGSGS